MMFMLVYSKLTSSKKLFGQRSAYAATARRCLIEGRGGGSARKGKVLEQQRHCVFEQESQPAVPLSGHELMMIS